MTCQLNFPSMSVLPSCENRHGAGCGTLRGGWSLTRWQSLLDDVIEEPRLHAAIGVGSYVLALLEEFPVGGLIQHRTAVARIRRPLREFLRWHRVHVKCHAREAVAAEVC